MHDDLPESAFFYVGTIDEAVEKARKAKGELNDVISKIVNFFVENKSTPGIVKPILDSIRELGYDNPKEINNIDDANKILEIIENL